MVTVIVRDPEAADDDTVIFTRISVGLFTTVLLTTISPPKFNEVTPVMN